MKQFRFIGGEDSIYWGIFEPNQVYDEDFKEPSLRAVIELAKIVPQDWEEVTEQKVDATYPGIEPDFGKPYKIPNKDQPASEMTKFEMAVFMVLSRLYGKTEFNDLRYDETFVSEKCISQVKETFKQLDELK